MNGNDDEGEEHMVFEYSPTYEDVVVKVRSVLHWMDPSDEVKLIGRYDVGVGVKSRLKSMPITSELHWKVYKGKVEQSQDNSLELFATKVDAPVLQIDLNWHASSPIHDGRAEVYAPNSYSQPPSSQSNEAEMNDRAIVIEDPKILAMDHVDDDDAYAEEEEIHYNPIGNLDVIVHQDMDRSLPYNRMCGYGSDDEGPEEDLDEDGFTVQET